MCVASMRTCVAALAAGAGADDAAVSAGRFCGVVTARLLLDACAAVSALDGPAAAACVCAWCAAGLCEVEAGVEGFA